MKTQRELYEKLGMRIFNILNSERGQTLVEYVLIVVLIAIVVMVMLTAFGQKVNCTYSTINSRIPQ